MRFGGCLECSWSKTKELRSAGKGGEAKGKQIHLKREMSLISLPGNQDSLITSHDFSSPAPQPHSQLPFPVCGLPAHHFSSHISSKKRAGSQGDFSGYIN